MKALVLLAVLALNGCAWCHEHEPVCELAATAVAVGTIYAINRHEHHNCYLKREPNISCSGSQVCKMPVRTIEVCQ